MSDLTESDLIGSWSLQGWEIEYSDDRPLSHPFGVDAEGWLVYAPDGGMAAQIACANRPHFSTGNARSASDHEKRAAFESFFAYSGTWELREGEVAHHVRHALWPNFVGTLQVRTAKLSGRVLKLSAQETSGGVTRTHRLVWSQFAGSEHAD